MIKALSYIKRPIKKIQGRSLDLYEVVDVMRNTQTDLRHLRSEESDFYQRCYDYAIRVCNIIGIEPSMPRITEKQVPRENTPAARPYDYYCVNVRSPFLRSQFLTTSISDNFKDDLTCPNLLDEEFRRWKNKRRTKIPSSRPNSVTKPLKVCDQDSFPNTNMYIYY